MLKRLVTRSTTALLVSLAALVLLATQASTNSLRPTASIMIHVAQSENPWVKLQDGRAVVANFGNATTKAESRSLSGAKSLSLASGDLNGDGFPDLVCGYAIGSGGLVTIQRGNPASYAPEDPEVLRGIGSGQFPDPFFKDSVYVEMLERPDFMGTIDFDRDGRLDIVTAARGSDALYLLSGDAHGGFSAPERVALPGIVTAMVTGKIDQPDGSTSVVLGLNVSGGSAIMIYEGMRSLLETTPVIHELTAEPSALALGRLDEDQFDDLAIIAGGQVLVLHGSGESQADNLLADKLAGRIEPIALPFAVQAMAVGQFVWNRDSRPEMALLAEDGAVHIAARGELDKRPFTGEEMLQKRIELERTRAEMQRAQRKGKMFMASSASAAVDQAAWEVVEDISAPVSKSFPLAETADGLSQYGATPILLDTRISTLPSDDLLIMNPAAGEFRISYNESSRPNQTQAQTESTQRSAVELASSSEPVAVLPMRVSVDGRPGLVVLTRDSSASQVIFPLAAITFHVTNAADSAVSVGRLRKSVIDANANAGADMIIIDPGISPTLTITSGGGHEDAAATGDLDITDSVSIVGQGSGSTIISTTYTNTCGDCKVFGVNQLGTSNGLSVSFTGVTIQNGFNDGTNFSGSFFETGGAIDFFMTGSGNNHSMTNCVITNNKTQNGARSHGGGVNVDGFNTATAGGPSGGSITFTGCSITNNSSTADGGGGMFLAADKHDANVTNCVITGNSCTGGTGGGMQVTHSFGGTVTISGASGSVSNNTASTNGGGIIVTFNQVTNISNITVSNNTATGTGGSSLGGGILIDTLGAAGVTGSTTLNTVTISTNHANNGANATGGGVRYGGFYGASMTSCTVSGNTSKNGAGVVNSGSTQTPAPTFAISGGSFTGNAATGDGGAFASTGTGSPTASVTTFSNVAIGGTGVGQPNTAVNGGGIANTQTGSVTVTGNSIAGNSATTNGGGIFISGGSFTLDGVTVDSNTATAGDGLHQSGGTFTGANTLNFNGNDSINIAGGTFTSTPGTLNLTGSFTRAAASTFNHNGGTFNFNGTTAQNINGGAGSEAFNNFIVNKSGTLAVGGSTTSLTMAGLVTLTAGTFDAGTATAIGLTSGNWQNDGATFTPASSTVTFSNAGGAQSITGSALTQTFNNITVTKAGQVLNVAGSTTTLNLNGSMNITAGNFNVNTAAAVNVGGDWTLAASPGATFTSGGGTNTVTFNGTGARNMNGTALAETFNNLVINKTGGGSVMVGGSTATLTINKDFTITAGTFSAGTATAINESGGNWSNSGTFAAGAGTVIFNANAVAQSLTGNTTFNNLTINHTGAGNVTNTGTLAATALLRVQSGTFITSSTFNNVQIDSGQTLQSDGSTMNVSGNWTNNGGTFTPNGNTVNFNGGGAQSISGSPATQTFNNFTVNKTGGSTLSVAASTTTLTITGGVTLTAGIFDKGTATTINVAGNWTNNGGSFTAGAGTVNFNGASAETIGGTTSTTFNNLTDANTLAGGNGITLSGNITVNGVLALGANNIDTSTFTITMPASGSSSGTGDVIGNVKRSGFVLGTPLSFGNPNNTIKIESGSIPTDINMNLVKAAPADFALAVQRKYTITSNGASGNVTLRLHYLDSELNSNDENTMLFRRFNGQGWSPVTPTSRDTTANWLEKTGQPQLSPWTFSSSGIPTATSGAIIGRITDANGIPVAGAVVNLNGTQNRKMITDANGNYRFDDVETSGFYTVRATRANYSFSPQERSFSQLGNQTEAAFTATALTVTSNPVDTAEYFVRQHYLDFLGREPEESGLNFWSDQILGCGGDAGCAEWKRINVSAAYFQSIEFQATGGLVDGLYRTSFDRAPRYAEFMPDSATIAKDLIVGRAGWEQRLAANRQAFLDAFVQRPEFQSVYGGLSNDQFVGQLLTHTRIIWTGGERTGLVDGLTNGTLTRAVVLGQIAGDQRFVAAKQNQMFVMMEYFGYLRRDPDAAGYQFWLNKLNQFNGNFEQAEMVKAFIVSGEYRDRFPR